VAKLDDALIFGQSSPIREHQRAAHSLGMPISTVSRRLVGAGVEAWRVAAEAHDAAVSLTAQGREYSISVGSR